MNTEDVELIQPDSNEEEDDIPTENVENIENVDEAEIDESDEDDMTPEQALQALENAWLNEKFAPELLPHQLSLVESMLKSIAYIETNLKKLDKGDIRINIHTMEISRIRFMISSYLRRRLEKIEEYAVHIMKDDSERSAEDAFMTPAETKFAREYIQNMENLFTNLVLQHMPSRLKEFELLKMSAKPNMNKHVFVRSNKDIKGILISNLDEAVDFAEGSQHIIQYSAIAHLVKNGDVQLI